MRGNQVVGNFHLLPVAHVPELQHGPLQATASSSNTATIDHAGHGQRSRRPQAWSETGLFQTAGAVDGVQACRNEYGGDSLGSVPPPPASSGGCFASGAVVGIMLSILSAWLVVSRGLGKESWERLRGRLAGANKRQAGRRQAIASVREAQKVSARNRASGHVGLLQVAEAPRCVRNIWDASNMKVVDILEAIIPILTLALLEHPFSP